MHLSVVIIGHNLMIFLFLLFLLLTNGNGQKWLVRDGSCEVWSWLLYGFFSTVYSLDCFTLQLLARVKGDDFCASTLLSLSLLMPTVSLASFGVPCRCCFGDFPVVIMFAAIRLCISSSRSWKYITFIFCLVENIYLLQHILHHCFFVRLQYFFGRFQFCFAVHENVPE